MSPTSDLLIAIGSLWKLVLGLTFIMFIWLFRQQLRSMMDRLRDFTFRRGNTEVSTTLAPDTDTSKGAIREPREGMAYDEQLSKDDEKEFQEDVEDEPFRRMWQAFRDRDLEAARTAFETMQATELDAVQKLTNEAIYYWLGYKAGDTSALRKLEQLSKEPAVSDLAFFWIGACYEAAGEFDLAAKAYEQSEESSDTEPERIRSLLARSKALFHAGRKGEAYSGLMRGLSTFNEPLGLSEIYEGMASLYELDDIREMQAIALEKAIEGRPNDVGLRFTTAFSYGGHDLDSLALLHYKALLGFNPNHAAPLNNIGIQYANLNMPIKGVTSQEEAAKLKSTLASANLASRYMQAGFKGEAAESLRAASEQPEVHPNVGSEIARLATLEETESQVEKNSLESAQQQQRFLKSFAEAYFTEFNDAIAIGGTWTSEDGVQFNISQTGSEFECTWHDPLPRKFTGSLLNRGARITTFRGTSALPSFTSSEASTDQQEYTQDGRGFCYISLEKTNVYALIRKESVTVFLDFTRAT